MKYSFALCDDEREHLHILKEKIINILHEKDYEVSIDVYESGLDLIEAIKNQVDRYDIIFLDMQMPMIDGLVTGKDIRELNKSVIIIYITGYKDFALNAFGIRAFDYILKPVNNKKLAKAIKDAIDTIGSLGFNRNKAVQCLAINVNKEDINIEYDDIIYFEKLVNKVIIRCIDKEYEIYESISNIIKMVDNSVFLQSHQGYIINKEKISGYESPRVILLKKYEIPVSRKNIKAVQNAFYESLR